MAVIPFGWRLDAQFGRRAIENFAAGRSGESKTGETARLFRDRGSCGGDDLPIRHLRNWNRSVIVQLSEFMRAHQHAGHSPSY